MNLYRVCNDDEDVFVKAEKPDNALEIGILKLKEKTGEASAWYSVLELCDADIIPTFTSES